MTLYEVIYMRRQVRKFNSKPVEKEMLGDILKCVSEADQLTGQRSKFEIASAKDVSGGSAPYYLLSYCDDNSAAYANVGYVLQKADLYIQSIGLGSGWFMGPKPIESSEKFCIALAFGNTDVPMRNGVDEFKRLPIEKISSVENLVTWAVCIAPSDLNTQPW